MSGPRFLIVKFSAIGDCVMAVPAVSAIRRTYDDAFIAWAVDPRCGDVVDTDRLVDVRYEVPRESWKKNHVSWWHQYRHFAKLRSFRFDYGIDFQGHSKTAICLRIARPKVRVASRATDLMSRLLNPMAPQKSRHWVERNLETLRSLGKFSDDVRPMMPTLEGSREALLDKMGPVKNLVTIAVSSGHPKKCYPLNAWASVAEKLLSLGHTVAFVGGHGDSSPNVPGAIDLIGRLSLAETMAAVQYSKVHLAADTGTGHIAAAYDVPVVSVFGYTDPAEYRPYTNHGIVLNAGKSMDAVTPDQIVEASQMLVEQQVHAVLN